ncbi:MAG: hypothetical protein Q8900_04305 [Bacillota bacterium]|nr:hypothetical protein [Bacillota bacterium]
MKRFKAFIIGIGVALFNLGSAFMQNFRPERCTGSCGNCGLSCVESVLGLAGAGVSAAVIHKLKGKVKKSNIKVKLK